MGVSKVTLNGVTLMDVTDKTVDTDNLLAGNSALRNDGESITGAVVTASPSDASPAMDGTASAGVATTYSRGDHVHPSDTNKANINNPSFTGIPTAPTASKGTDTTQIATTEFVQSAITDINYPVTSVNTKTGAVVLTASDVNALPDDTEIPTKTSDLTNDSGYITNSDIPVTSVNTKTGAVVLTAADINAQPQINISGILKGNGTGTITAATAGTDYQAPLPSQTGNTGKFLTTNGSALSWQTVDALPSQSGNTGKFLTTNGSSPSWAEVDIPTKTSELTNDSNFVSDANYVHTDNNFTGTLKTKLEGIAEGAEVNQNAFSNVKVGTSTIVADTKTDTLTLTAGSNITLTPDTTNDAVTIAATVPTKVSDLTNDSNFITAAGAPVQSVNSKTGTVTLTASDVGALPSTTSIPAATSDLTNDSGFITSSDIPVTSVNTKTGAVSLSASDVGALPSTTDVTKWNGVTLNQGTGYKNNGDVYVPYLDSATGTVAYTGLATSTPTQGRIAKYDSNIYLHSTTPTASDNSNKVATTAYVDSAISGLGSILNYKGTKATESALPSTGNVTGDVWIVNADNSEYVWNGTAWEKLGPTIDLSGYVPTTRTVNGKALSTDISLDASDVGALPDSTTIPTATSDLTNDSGFITSSDIPVTSVNSKTGAVSLTASDLGALTNSYFGYYDEDSNVLYAPKNWTYSSGEEPMSYYFPFIARTTSTTLKKNLKVRAFGSATNLWTAANSIYYNGSMQSLPYVMSYGIYLVRLNDGTTDIYKIAKASDIPTLTSTPTANKGAQYDSSAYLNSTTPSANDNSTKVATTAYVDNAVSSVDALPDQTGQNGKFLTTNGTTASWTDNPPEIFWITVNASTLTADKTFAEIAAAVGDNKLPIVLADGNSIYLFLYLGTTYMRFTRYIGASGKSLRCNSDDTWEIDYNANLQEQITASGLLKGDGSGGVTAATASDIPSLNYVSKVTSSDNAVVRFNGTGGAIQNSGVTIDDNNVLLAPAMGTSTNTYIEFPDGGGFRTTGSTQTGYLKIALPQSWTDTMMSFKVQMYQYNQNTSCEFTIGGYNYSSGGGTWTNRPFAYSIGKSDVQTYSNLTVRLGHDGTKCAVYIGEANTSWQYMQIQVHDVLVGYKNYEYDKWATGWSVGFTTTLGTITATITNPCVSHYATTAGTATSATSATSATTATTASASNALNFVQTNELLLGNTNAQNRIWINYRRVVNGATSGNTAITEYHFGNGNAGTTGVTLYAANFSGVAAKATAANVTTTANALAVYSDTTGTFSGKASANGALYATAANGAWSVGALPIAQGGTGKTTAADARAALGAAASSHNHAAGDINSGTLGVARGGTGAASFTANCVVMSGSSTTAALTTRAVTNNTSATALAANTNIPTQNTVYYGLNHRLNRTTAVNAADTGYTTIMARGMGLRNADTNPSLNGAINWTYG